MIRFHCPAGWFAARTVVVLLTIFAASTLTYAAEPGSAEAVPAIPKRWLLVDTDLQTLSVMEGSKAIYHAQNIAIGSNGTGNRHDKRLRDEKTPLGDFTITAIRPSNRFHLFVGFDYPTMSYADAAVADGRITQEEYLALQNAWHQNLPIPQSTGLGGHFGIHGVGAGNARIHRLINWTNGCIALTNAQIEQLTRMIEVGTPVSIR